MANAAINRKVYISKNMSSAFRKHCGVAEKFHRRERIVVYPGNCLDVLKEIPDQCIQLVVTSSPYNIGKTYEKKLDLDQYLDQQANVISECVRVLASSGSICWQTGNYVDKGSVIPLDTILYPVFSRLGLRLRNRIVWHFEHGLHCAKRFSGRYETILWFTKSNNYPFNLDPVRVPQKYPGKKHFKGRRPGNIRATLLEKIRVIYGTFPTSRAIMWKKPNIPANSQ